MRYCILILLLLISLPLSAQNSAGAPSATQTQDPLVRDIIIKGFVLQDKGQFTRLFKPYRNKHLATRDMDEILQQIEGMYEREGYLQLVKIDYQVVKHRLVFTVSMTS